MFNERKDDMPVLGILLGDAAGIGPEIVAKVAAKGALNANCHPIIIGDLRVMKQGMEIAGVDFPYTVVERIEEASWENGIPVLDLKDVDPAKVKMGEVSEYCGKAEGQSLLTSIDFFNEGKIDGFVFAPLNKASMKKGGFNYESEHTLFAEYFNWTQPSGEMNVLGNLWTSRVTSHIPISEVSSNISVDNILSAIKLADKTLKRAEVENVRIGVAALNPHAGDYGTCGREEIDIIIPAMEEAGKLGINTFGPYPADIMFIKAFEGEVDAVVTMYHDQGQIAMKLKGFEYAVTVAAGLPAPITTPAHGTAFNIAGKGMAKTTAFENALDMCIRMARTDKKNRAEKQS